MTRHARHLLRMRRMKRARRRLPWLDQLKSFIWGMDMAMSPSYGMSVTYVYRGGRWHVADTETA